MARHRRSPLSNDPLAYAKDVLDRTVDILVAMGHSPKDLAALCAQKCRNTGEPARPFDPDLLRYVEKLPHILALWYMDPAYVDDRARPYPLPLKGRNRSLAELIERVLPGKDPREVARTLVATGAVCRKGNRYAPMRQYMALNESWLFAHAHSLISVRGLLRTVQHNMACAEPAGRLLERSAANPSIPIRVLPAVNQYLKRKAATLLSSSDRFLRQQEVPPGSEPCTSVHLVVYAHHDPRVLICRTAADPVKRRRPGKGRKSTPR